MGRFLQLTDNEGKFNISPLALGILLLFPIIGFVSPRAFSFFIPAGGLLLLVAYLLRFRAFPKPPAELCLWLFAILGLSAISVFWSVDAEISFERTQKLAIIILPSLLFIGVICNLNVQFCQRFCFIFAGASTFFVLLTFSEIMFDYPVFRVLNGEIDESIHASRLNRLLVSLAVTLVISSSLLALALTSRKKILSFLILFACVPLIIWGESQSMILAFTLSLIAFFFFPYGKKWAWYLIMALISILMFVAPFVVSYAYNEFADSVAQTPFVGRYDGYGAERLEIWDMVARYALQNPLYGYGIEATRIITDFENGGKFRSSNTALHPHNFALQIWIEFGLVGVLFVTAFLSRLIWHIQKLPYQKARLALALTIYVLTVASFAYGLWQSWFVGFMMALYVIFIAYNKMIKSTVCEKSAL